MTAARRRPAPERHGRSRTFQQGLPSSSRSYVGYLHVVKAGGAVIFRSAIEYDALGVLAMDHAVVRISRCDYTENERIEFDVAERPAATTFELPGLGSYTPDLRIVLDDGQVVFVEVGYHAEKIDDPETFTWLQAAAIECAAIGAGFLILTERTLR
jgi:hypothetical protein